MHPKHIFVTAAAGRTVPVHPSHASAPGGALLLCVEGKVYRLPYNTDVRRAIADGDLIPCTSDGKVGLKHHHEASANDPVELDDTGAVATSPTPEVHHTPALAETASKFDNTDTAAATPTKGV